MSSAQFPPLREALARSLGDELLSRDQLGLVKGSPRVLQQTAAPRRDSTHSQSRCQLRESQVRSLTKLLKSSGMLTGQALKVRCLTKLLKSQVRCLTKLLKWVLPPRMGTLGWTSVSPRTTSLSPPPKRAYLDLVSQYLEAMKANPGNSGDDKEADSVDLSPKDSVHCGSPTEP